MRHDPARRTFVLVHGAWHGGWCWRAVADLLRAGGHTVFTPTQTGLGERAHLLSREITLDTFIEDIAQVLRFEQLEDVVLVGHSFGGIAISGVADRMPERLRHLVYLDSLLLQHAQTALSRVPPDVAAARLQAAQDSSGGLSLPAPPAAAFGLLRDEDQASVAPRLTPHPMATYTSPLHLKHELANGVPRTYIVCTQPLYAALASSRDLARALGWPLREIANGHDAMVSAPAELAALLTDIAG
jgi:pimeloyl-ACP methyl ester carboxylesterase